MADSPDLAHTDPGTHALLIGVGKDPHLTGGDGPSSEAADGMQQLSSPPVPPAQWRTGCSEYRFPGQAAGQSVPLAQ